MAPRRFLLWQHWITSIGYCTPFPHPFRSNLTRASCCCPSTVTGFADRAGHRYSSSITELQEPGVSETKWLELPPVPKQGRKWTERELRKGGWNSGKKRSENEGQEYGTDDGIKQVTALQWVAKCCPSIPNSLLHKLFRLRQVHQQTLLLETQHQERHSDPSPIQQLQTRMRKVSVKALLEEGAVLCLPKSVLQYPEDVLPMQNSKKTEHPPTKAELAHLQSLVLYKDSEILVINKPPGLPVQGGTQIKRSLDSLMGTALSFDYSDGPRLVHRLDKESSEIMILARTQESAVLLHVLFREKTATVTESKNGNASIKRVYWAVVIGVPKRAQGRISVPLMKVVLDEGRADKVMVCHDLSSENAQPAVTDFEVIGPSHRSCTWVELNPLMGRKHQ